LALAAGHPQLCREAVGKDWILAGKAAAAVVVRTLDPGMRCGQSAAAAGGISFRQSLFWQLASADKIEGIGNLEAACPNLNLGWPLPHKLGHPDTDRAASG
jgi:hypothetical protein